MFEEEFFGVVDAILFGIVKLLMMNPAAVERAVASTRTKSWGSSNTSKEDIWGDKIYKAVRYCARISKAI